VPRAVRLEFGPDAAATSAQALNMQSRVFVSNGIPTLARSGEFEFGQAKIRYNGGQPV